VFFNQITKIVPAVAIGFGALATATSASASEDHSFVRDGVSYDYITKDVGGATVLAGRAGDEEFRLVVKDGVVRGEFNGKSVRFPVALAASDAVLATK